MNISGYSNVRSYSAVQQGADTAPAPAAPLPAHPAGQQGSHQPCPQP